jgi:putative glycosyltransferase (TIGR04372 family)
LKNFLLNQIKQIRVGGFKIFIFKVKIFFFIILYFIIGIFIFPIFIIIRLISQVILIRFGGLPSNRIGHFAVDVNQYIAESQKKNILFFDFFYLQKPVCNYALVKLFKNYLFIFPRSFIYPFIMLNKIKFIGNIKHEITLTRITSRDLRDLDFTNNINYKFDKKDILYGNHFLKNVGLNKDDKFICLIVRDNAYLKKHEPYKNWDYHNYRDCNINNFKLASDYLTSLGYYVFRMGAEVLKPMLINNNKIIDYATLGFRNELLDIFLFANCEFCITTGVGLDGLAEIFRKPIVQVSFAPIGYVRSSNKKHLTIFKKHLTKKDRKSLTLTEIFELNLANALSSKVYKDKKIDLVENTPEEIKEATIEMIELIKNNFLRDYSKEYLEFEFWNIFRKKIKNYNLENLHANFFKAHIGQNFLQKNLNFLK